MFHNSVALYYNHYIEVTLLLKHLHAMTIELEIIG